MRDNYLNFSRILLGFCMFFTTSVFAQLSDFNFSVIATNETCTGNGTMTFNVSGTAPGSTMLYSVYLLPNTTTPVTVTSNDNFTGLSAGTYQITATQTLNGSTGSQQEVVTIVDEIEDLDYTIGFSLGECGLTAIIEVDVNQGHPEFYEILSGPQTFPQQSGNTFTVNQSGTYIIRVTDECGEAVVQTYVLEFSPGVSLPFSANANTTIIGCNLMELNQSFTTTGTFAYPLQVTYTITPPNGIPITSTFTVESGGAQSVTLSQSVFLTDGDTYSYLVTVVDACGYTYDDDGEIEYDFQDPVISQSGQTCDSVSFALYFALSATITEAPAEYQNALPFELTINENNVFPMPNLPPGTYTVIAIDTCNNPQEIEFTVPPPSPTDPQAVIQLGCAEGMASIYLRAFQGITEVQVISAPSTYPDPLPHDVTFNLDVSGALRMANLPAGDYVFHIVNTCGQQWDFPVHIDGLIFEANVEIVEHCGTFDLFLTYADNSTSQATFYLQKYYPLTDSWGHPGTGALYTPNTAPSPTTARQLYILPQFTNLNLPYTGHFRVFSYRQMYALGDDRYCLNVLSEFDALGPPVIDDAYSFSCNDATFDVIVDAHGMEPLQYRITTFNDGPFVVDNGTSNIFTGLVPGLYNFQVEDVCHNISNRIFEISEPYSMQISGSGTCEGQPVTLSVPDYSFLTYNWYSDDPNVILSTSATLEIPEFSSSDLGSYHVHIFTDNPESCIDVTLDFTLGSITPLAQAGLDSTETYCGNQGTIDLTAFLSGNFQSDGTWSENTNSGTLSANVWDSSNVAAGTYVFVYTKTSDCGPDDSSVHSFTINAAPENPVAFIEQDVCQQGDLNLLSTTIAGATYQWTGPNGFTSTEQNPIIPNATSANNGTYTVQAFIGNCPSEIASLPVVLGELPEFTISAQCQNDRMMMTASTTSADTFTFQWSGPGGFTSTLNPVDITGNSSGQYSLTVTNLAGCSETFQQAVTSTLCRVPQGISANDDGENDNFDLSGFGDNLKVKIFNRYGMVVYEMNNYIDQWHGQCKDGTLLPSATYYYYIQDEVGKEKTGWVYLLQD